MSTTTARRAAKPASLRRLRKLRAEVEAEIERLIAWLDVLDGDCDLEDDDPREDDTPREIDEDAEPDMPEVRRHYADARRPYCTRVVRYPTSEPGVYMARRELVGAAARRAAG